MLELTAQNVHDVVLHCLYQPDELNEGKPPANGVYVEAVVRTFCFHPERLEARKSDIQDLISQTPDAFHTGKGGGWSFLQLCMNQKGEQWGEPSSMEALVALAIGTKQGSFCLSREYWGSLPGDMPYIVFEVKH